MDIAQILLTKFNDDAVLLEKVITGDETWVYGYDIKEVITGNESWVYGYIIEPKAKSSQDEKTEKSMSSLVICEGSAHCFLQLHKYGQKVITGDESWLYSYDI